MFSRTTPSQTNGLADQAVQSADKAIAATRLAAEQALDGLSEGVHDARMQAEPLLDRAAALASRGADAVRDGSERVRLQAQRASDSTVGYIREEPVKSMLIAAATGAALMAVLSLVSRSRR